MVSCSSIFHPSFRGKFFLIVAFRYISKSVPEIFYVLYQNILDKPDGASNKIKALEFLDLKRYSLFITTFFTFSFLVVSIFSSMASIATIGQFEPTDTYGTFSFLFGPLLYALVAIMFLAISLLAMPIRPPLEEKED